MSQKTSPKSNIVVNGVTFTVATKVRKYSDGTYETTILAYESPSSSTEILIAEKIGNKIVFNDYDYDSSSIGEANGNILKSQAGSAALLNTSKEQVESVKSNFATTSEEISAYDSMNGSPNQATDTTNQESTSDTGSSVPSPAGLPAGSPDESQTTTTSFASPLGETKVEASDYVLRYPFNQSDSTYDYIKIQPFKYVPSLSQSSLRDASGNDGITPVTKRPKEFTGPMIFLPMTPTISETNAVGWGKDELNPIQQRFGAAALRGIDQAVAGLEDGKILESLSGIVGTSMGAANDLIQSQGVGAFIRSYFAGQAVRANLLGRTGIVINPNLELLFQGPKLRSFRYTFTFTPRDPKEASVIREIIKTFKKTMAVKRLEGQIFLGTPDIYDIKYVFNGGTDHPFLNKIKPCALTGFSVNYAPDGSFMTYQNGSMTSYGIDMQFDELEPIYNDDINSNVNTSTMGF